MTPPSKHLIYAVLVVAASCNVLPQLSYAWTESRDAFARPASWQMSSFAATKETVLPWCLTAADSPEAREQLERIWNDGADGNSTSPLLLERVASSLALVDTRAKELVDLCHGSAPARELSEFAVLQDSSLPKWTTADLRLLYGVWLANQQLYDESASQLTGLSITEVSEPATLLFYQSVVAHRRLEKAECLATLAKLLENKDHLPKRYTVLAELMQSDLEPLKPDSLDEVSRLMDNVKVRLGHGRAGTRVRKEEDDVIAKLDKLIEQLESQAAAAAAAASGSNPNGKLTPSNPAQDSMRPNGSGAGNVDPKQLGANIDWGNLPPQEREAALQELSKDLPSHYRDVIEEYFRKLARDNDSE